ncbi:MAG: Cu(I)-responsive transcriptional regulator [Proteobacteria bacterium]|nr:Cu(I)-responsive transcriptional regulator [Pseudomonadota bacterium]
MNIGSAAKASGVSAKMIRYYEEIALLPAAKRTASGYRDYGQSDVHRLQFIHRARDLGFSVERIRLLLQLWNDRKRPSREVKSIATAHIAEVEDQIRRMQGLLKTLRHLADACDGDGRPHCPILEDLAEQGRAH